MRTYNFKLDTGPMGVTPIPNVFIEEYMPHADGSFVKVFLWGLMEALNGNSISCESLSKKLGLIESDIIRAWNYWESQGIVKLNKSEYNTDIEFINLFNYPGSASKPMGGQNTYSPEYIRYRLEKSNIKEMFENIEKLLGRALSPREISMYLSWIDDYSFSPEVIILLIEFCKAKNKVDSRYIETVAIAWHDSNVKTIEDAQRYISQHEGKYSNYRQVLDFLGLRDGDIMKPQEEFLDKWFNTWNFPLEVILEACKICSLRINEPNFSYIDGILSNWYKKGLKTLKDIESCDTKSKASKNVRFKAPVNSFNSYTQRTYDVKELENRLLGRDEEVDHEQ